MSLVNEEEAVKVKVTVYLRQLKHGKQWYASWRASAPDDLVYRRVSKPTGIPERPRQRDRGKQEARDAAMAIREAWLQEEAKAPTPEVPSYG